MSLHVLRGGGAALVVDDAAVGGSGYPVVLHWGRDVGTFDDADAAAFALASMGAVVANQPDTAGLPSLLPVEADQWRGRPGLSGHRAGAAVHPRWRDVAVVPTEGQLRLSAADPTAGLSVTTVLRLDAAGVLTIEHILTNTAPNRTTQTSTAESGEGLDVSTLLAYLPVPHEAGEVLDLTGRWSRERSPQRSVWWHGGRVRESRRGRTGHEATLVMAVGSPGFGFRCGEVWATHVGWSGDHVHLAERHADSAGPYAGLLGGGELLRPGEVHLSPGESYTTPTVYFAWSDTGLDGISAAFHSHIRARDSHPRRPRPVTLNVWEAVYFDHRLDRLLAIAEAAAAVGVERLVLDDGWFGARRDDHRGLGDWYVSTEVWPDGLHPLVDRVTELGMEFGLWVEPEMVQSDSDIARAHPDWVLAAARLDEPERLPPPSRRQQVFDLTNPEAWAYLLQRLDALVAEYRIPYLKWDHNRDLLEAVGSDGRAGVHAQTLAVYALLDELKARHPGLEIESCSSGGGRVDLGVLARTDRVWASDCNDALERQLIQRWTQLLLPPELIGSHIGPPRSHTTARVIDLPFRALTSFFNHAGLEWDITECDEADLARVRRWIQLHKRHRSLLHNGVTVRSDDAAAGSEGSTLHGVVAPDRSEALYAWIGLATSADAAPGRVRFPGLDPERRYRVEVLDLTGDGLPPGMWQVPPRWLADGAVELPGAVLVSLGLPMLPVHPMQGLLLHVRS